MLNNGKILKVIALLLVICTIVSTSMLFREISKVNRQNSDLFYDIRAMINNISSKDFSNQSHQLYDDINEVYLYMSFLHKGHDSRELAGAKELIGWYRDYVGEIENLNEAEDYNNIKVDIEKFKVILNESHSYERKNLLSDKLIKTAFANMLMQERATEEVDELIKNDPNYRWVVENYSK